MTPGPPRQEAEGTQGAPLSAVALQAAPAPPARAALGGRGREFQALWAASTVSQFGSMLGALTLTALIYLHASPKQMGLLAASTSAPVLLVSLLAGVWIDRLPRRQVMVFADCGRFLLLTSVPVAALLHRLHLEQLYVVAFLAGSLDVLFNLAYRSVLPALVPRERLVDANSTLQMSEAVAQSVSPALGGAVVQLAGGPVAVLLDALTFLASGMILGRRRWPAGSAPARGRSAIAEALVGFKATLGEPLLRAIFGMAGTYSFFSGFLLALYGLWVVRELHFSALALGVLMAAGGAGSLVGAGLTSWTTRRLGLGPAIVLPYGLAAAALAAIPLAGSFGRAGFLLLLFDQFFGDILWIIHNVDALSLRQAITPAGQLGRVNASFLLASQGLRPLGALVAGFAAASIGVRTAIVITVVGINLAGLWLFCSPLVRIRTAPELSSVAAESITSE